jgi:hypothetical protein
MRKAWVLMAGMAAAALTSGALAAAPEPLSDAALDAVTAGAVTVQIIGADGVQTFNVGTAAYGGSVVVNLLTSQTTGFITNNGVLVFAFDPPELPPLPGTQPQQANARSAAAPAAAAAPTATAATVGPIGFTIDGGVVLNLSSTSSYP